MLSRLVPLSASQRSRPTHEDKSIGRGGGALSSDSEGSMSSGVAQGRGGGGGEVARIMTSKNTAQVHVLRDRQKLGRLGVLHSDARSTWWGRRTCSSARRWHSVIISVTMTDVAVQPGMAPPPHGPRRANPSGISELTKEKFN